MQTITPASLSSQSQATQATETLIDKSSIENAEPQECLDDQWLRDSVYLPRLIDSAVPKSKNPVRRFLHRAGFAVTRRIGRAFTFLALRGMNPQTPLPPPTQEVSKLIPYEKADKRIPLKHVYIGDRLPTDERCTLERVVFGVQRGLSKLAPVDSTDIPEISTDLAKNVENSVPRYFFNLPWVVRPQTPQEVTERPYDVLGALTLAGPFAAYIESTGQPGRYRIDLSNLSEYPVRDGLSPLGFIAEFRYDETCGQMITERIYLPAENKRVVAHECDSKEWERAQRIALASLSTHMTAVRHLGWTHLAVGEAFSNITSTHLSPTHPVHTILHPHLFRTRATNAYRIPSLISDETSALPSVFGYDKKQTLRLLDDAALQFDLARLDPVHDAHRRGVFEDSVNYPYLQNVGAIWDIMQTHVRAYVEAFYKDDAHVQACPEIRAWYDALGQVRGAHDYAGPLGIEALVKLITVAMYAASVEHENVGNMVVNYTTLPQIPSSVGLDGSRQSEAVFQAYMNLLLLTSTPSHPLLGNDYPNMPQEGKAVMSQMTAALKELDATLRQQAPVPLHTVLPSQCEAAAST